MTYEYTNAYFKNTDPKVDTLGNFAIPESWWSRKSEYVFAMSHAAPNQIVADMGIGWNYRPLHDWLSMVCDFVYGVDNHPGILELPPMTKGAYVVADFSQPIDAIPAASLDRIFCISVLEELPAYAGALSEFARLLKPDGRIVITMDAKWSESKPAHEKYKGVNFDDFEAGALRAGLEYDGAVNYEKPNGDEALHNDDLNLCVFHCVLKKASK
jgi:SAM-dependent methyltransferase